MKQSLKRDTLLLGAALSVAGLGDASAGRLSPDLLARAKAGDKTPTGVIVRFSLQNNAQGRAAFKNLRVLLQQNIAKLGPAAGFVTQGLNNGGRELWLDQSVFVKMSPVDARALATLPIVDEIFPNFKVQIPRVAAQSAATTPSGTSAYLQQIGAPAAWAAGFKGQGVRIGHLDSGIDASHPELSGKVLAYAEFDGDGNKVNSQPHDTGNHGTHTAGLLVGNTVGVAPDAKLLSALVLPNNEGTFAEVIAGMQWVLDPDNNADTNDGANVVSMSLGLPGTYQEFVVPVKNMLKAGVVPVFAIGNYGPSASTTGSPGNIPDVIGVGAVDGNGQVASFSSRGPVAWTGAYSGVFTKPDIAAPGVAITSSFPGGGYGSLSGSSQAAPIVAGAVAVMLSAKPGTGVDTIKDALYTTASNNGSKNNNTGYGLMSLGAALGKLGVNVAAQPAPTTPTQPTPTQPTTPVQPTPTQPTTPTTPTQPTPTQPTTPTTPAQPAAQPTAPAGYTLCAPEGGVCKNVANREVAFGTAGGYVFGTNDASPDFNCTVQEWGKDPAPGKLKGCFVKGAAPTPTQPTPAQPTPTQPSNPTPTQPAQPSSGTQPSILLVDDSQGAGLINALKDAVKAVAKPGGAFAWNVAAQGSVPLSELKKYQVVLWLTGEQYQNTLTTADQQNLSAYLQSGGRLIVSGQDVGYDIGNTSFYKDILKTQFVADSSGNAKFVTSGALGNVAYNLNAAGSVPDQYYPDVIANIGSGVVAASWGSAGATAATIQAQSIKVDPLPQRGSQKAQDPRGLVERLSNTMLGQVLGQVLSRRAPPARVRAQSAGEDAGAIVLNNAGTYRTVNMGFGLEGLTPSSRTTLLKSAVDWLMK